MKVQLNDRKYLGHDCIEFTNGTIQLLIPKDFGPRIYYAGFRNEKNLFGACDATEPTTLGLWKIYGGHRLWTSPEINPDTYYPDNDKIGIKKINGQLSLTQDIKLLGIKKEVRLKFTAGNTVEVVNTIHNTGSKTLKLAVWALSVMAKGGFAVIPQNDKRAFGSKYLPNRNIVFWNYVDVADKRLKLTNKYCFVRQGGKPPLKIGQLVTSGWAAYFNSGYLFIKKIKFEHEKLYSDMYSNVEVYSCKDFLELETLGPLAGLKKGSCVSHAEVWEFYRNQKLSFGSENVKIPWIN